MILNSVTVQRNKKLSAVRSREFTGEVYEGGFKVYPNLSYRNSFMPVIMGRIRPDRDGCMVYLDMRMHRLTAAFCTVWLCGVFFGLLCGVLLAITKGIVEAFPMLAVPGIMILLEQIMMRSGFRIPTEKSVKRLMELLDGTNLEDKTR